jgi:hypothetical protein
MSSTHTRPAASCREHRSLLEYAVACDQKLARFPGEEHGHRRAREILTALAGHCRAVAAGVFEVDPTLADEPPGTGRFRAIDLFTELVRQTQSMLINACTPGTAGLDRWPRETRWAEAEALYERAVYFAEVIPQAVPRRDHATKTGSRMISRDRLAANYETLAIAAEGIRAAVASALRLPHPDPQVLALIAIADQLTRHADELGAHHQQRTDALGAACGLPGYDS